jgi:hypothetical protein
MEWARMTGDVIGWVVALPLVGLQVYGLSVAVARFLLDVFQSFST